MGVLWIRSPGFQECPKLQAAPGTDHLRKGVDVPQKHGILFL